jgi:hypothetical protein
MYELSLFYPFFLGSLSAGQIDFLRLVLISFNIQLKIITDHLHFREFFMKQRTNQSQIIDFPLRNYFD